MTMSNNRDQQEDPVCGMMVDASTANFKTDHEQKTYFFCCKECLDTFKDDPEQFTEEEE